MARGTYERKARRVQRFGRENPRKGHTEDKGVDGRIILKWILNEIVRDDVEWIDLAQDRDRWPLRIRR